MNPFVIASFTSLFLWGWVREYAAYKINRADSALYLATSTHRELLRHYKQLFGVDSIYCLYLGLLLAAGGAWTTAVVMFVLT